MSPRPSLIGHAWTDRHWEVFRLAPRDWTPPAQVQVGVNSARDRMTFTAWFIRSDGQRVKLTTVAKRGRGGAWLVVDEHLDVRMIWKAEA